MSDPYPWYPWYPSDWLASGTVRAMTLEERAVYRELLDHQWKDGSLPTDLGKLQRLAGATAAEFKRVWPAVSQKFIERDGRFYNERLEAIRAEQLALADGRSTAASTAARARWNRHASRNA